MNVVGDGPDRLFVAADAVNCRSGTALDRAATRRGLLDLLDAATGAVGLSRLDWRRDRPEEGELAELPAEAPAVAERFLVELDAELFRYNVTRQRTARLRCRVAVHSGRRSAGWLVDSVPLHEALRLCPEASIAMLLGFPPSSGAGLRPEWLRRLRPGGQLAEDDVWLLMPGHDVNALRLKGFGAGAEDQPERRGRPSPRRPHRPAPGRRPELPSGCDTPSSTA